MMLSGKTMLVTGGAGGIGGSIVSAGLAAGARVVVWDLADPGKAGVAYSKIDLTREDQVRAGFDELDRQGLTPSVLVNAVGIFTHLMPFSELSFEGFKEVLLTNAGSYFLTCREALRRCPRNLSIVNVSSALSVKPIGLSTAYSASKAVIDSLTRSIAVEYGPKGVRANGVNPGPVSGVLLDKGVGEIASLLNCPPQAVMEQILSVLPNSKLVESCEIAQTVIFLASDLAKNINGQSLNICGGYAF